MNEKTYPSDLTDEEWEWIKELIPAAKSGGRPRTLCLRAVLNAIFYVTKGGLQGRMLPTNFPKWQSVYHYLRAWKRQGVWGRIHDTLRARVREKEARHTHPTAGCLDSQSVKTPEVGGADRGFDNGKKVKGRKRHVLVDTLGLLRIAVVTAASLSDQAGARKSFQQMRGPCKKLRKVWVDGTYRGAEWTAWGHEKYHRVLESVARAEGQKGFAVLPHRWVVERTLAWLNQCRRLSKDYEELPGTSETFVYVAMTRLMLKRLAA
jgi:putative transposase